LFLLLQSMYSLCSSAPETNFIKYIDHVWVLSKDVFLSILLIDWMLNEYIVIKRMA
jgi:hypothetical protein